MPPEPVTGVNDTGWFTVSVVAGTDCAAVTALFTVREKVAVAVAWFASVTVIVYTVCALTAVGVPVIKPVVGLRLRPAGRSGEIV